MKKFIPYHKLSKKARKQLDAKRRGSWGNVCPVTRCEPDQRVCRHAKHRLRRDVAADWYEKFS